MLAIKMDEPGSEWVLLCPAVAGLLLCLLALPAIVRRLRDRRRGRAEARTGPEPPDRPISAPRTDPKAIASDAEAVPSHVTVYDADARRTYRIPAAELAPGMVRVQVQGLDASEPVWMDPGQLHPGEIRHPPFEEDVRALVRDIMEAFAEFYTLSLDEWEDGFRRDGHPEREIAIWSHAAGVYRAFADPAAPAGHRRELYRLVVACMNAPPEHVWHVVRLDELPHATAEQAVARFYGPAAQPLPPAHPT